MARITRMVRKRMGELLREEKLVSPEQLEEALEEQKYKGGFLGEILVEKGYAAEEDIAAMISRQFGLPFIDPTLFDPMEETEQPFPLEILHGHQVVPLDQLGATLSVVTSSLLDEEAITEMETFCGKHIFVYVGTTSAVRRVLAERFPREKKEPTEHEGLTLLGNMLLGDAAEAEAAPSDEATEENHGEV